MTMMWSADWRYGARCSSHQEINLRLCAPVFTILLISLHVLSGSSVSVTGGVERKCVSARRYLHSSCQGALAELNTECSVDAGYHRCRRLSGKSANSSRKYLQVAFRFKPKPVTVSVKSEDVSGGHCYDIKIQAALQQHGIGALVSETSSRTRRNADGATNPLDSAIQQIRQEEDQHRSASASFAKVVSARIESVTATRGIRVTHSEVESGRFATISVLIRDSQNGSSTIAAGSALKIIACVSYEPYVPALYSEQSSNVKETTLVFADPPITVYANTVTFQCVKCANSAQAPEDSVMVTPPPRLAAGLRTESTTTRDSAGITSTSGYQPSTATTTTTTTTTPTMTTTTTAATPHRTTTSRSSVSSFTPSAKSKDATSSRTHPMETTTTRTYESQAPGDTTSRNRFRTVRLPRPTTGNELPLTPGRGAPVKSQTSDSDLGVLLTGQRLYITCAALGVILILLLIVILLIVRRRKTGSRREVASPDIPSAFSTLVSSTNTTATRTFAPTPTKSKPSKHDLGELTFTDGNVTFPRVSSEDTPAHDFPSAPNHYRSTSIYKARRTHSEQDVMNQYENEGDGRSPTDVLFYTVTKSEKTTQGYTALRPDAVEKRGQYANTYSAPRAAADNPKQEKQGRKSMKQKKSLSLDIMPTSAAGKTSSLPRTLGESHREGRRGSDSDVSQDSFTFPQVSTTNLRGPSLNSVQANEDESRSDWPDFALYTTSANPMDGYASLNNTLPTPVKEARNITAIEQQDT